MNKNDIIKETLKMNERIEKFERKVKSNLILSKIKCKGFYYNI